MITPWGIRVFVLWILYFSVLLLIEYFGYRVFEIREMTSEKPLCFGLIHGTPILKMYYLTAGILAVFLSRIFERAFQVIFFSSGKQNAEGPEL